MGMILTGSPVSATEMERLGVVTRIIAPEKDVVEEALGMAQGIASFSAPAVALAKQAVAAGKLPKALISARFAELVQRKQPRWMQGYSLNEPCITAASRLLIAKRGLQHSLKNDLPLSSIARPGSKVGIEQNKVAGDVRVAQIDATLTSDTTYLFPKLPIVLLQSVLLFYSIWLLYNRVSLLRLLRRLIYSCASVGGIICDVLPEDEGGVNTCNLYARHRLLHRGRAPHP